MIRNFTLSILLTVSSLAISKNSFATIINVTGTSNTNYALSAGDTLFIRMGANYTGTVSGLNANTKTIIVEGGATFNPTLLQPTNGVVCKIKNYGTFTYSASLTTNTNFTLDNYAGGVVNLAAMDTKGRDQVWTNNIGGVINFSGPVVINGGTSSDDNNIFINYETINANNSFQMNSGSFFYNYKDFNVGTNYKANGGTLRNEGNFVVTGLLEINSGATPVTNYCRLEASGGIKISNSTFTNYTYVWAKNSEIEITSGGITNVTIPGATAPIIHGKSYRQTGGAVTGSARMYFWDNTLISGGSIGAVGATTDTIKVNDITRTSPSTIFDVQGVGTVRPNVIYNQWGAPDSTVTYMFGCSVEIFLEIPLAVNWRSFEVILGSQDIPLLLWSAEFDRQTIFEIERSYDGRYFTKIDQVQSVDGKIDYRYSDKSVNSQNAVVYYRIKALELGSEPKFSKIKLVRFDKQATTSMQTAPNPYRSNFDVLYHAAEAGNITIRVFNVNGQQKFAKKLTVNKGNNTINITEASQLASGIYIVQVTGSDNKVLTSKLIKQ